MHMNHLDDKVTVSPQITVEDVAVIAAEGFDALMCNRPDGEDPTQTPWAEIEAAGVTVYQPDNAAFQEHVLGVYRDSKYSADWPEGLVDAISAIGQ